MAISDARTSRPSSWLIAGGACGLAAAWIAAGSTGLIAHGLRHAITWLLLGGAVVLAWPRGTELWQRVSVVAAVIAAVLMTASSIQAVNLFAAPVVLAALSHAQAGPSRRVILLCAGRGSAGDLSLRTVFKRGVLACV